MSTWNWVVAIVVTVLLVALLAFARGNPRAHRLGSLSCAPATTVTRVA